MKKAIVGNLVPLLLALIFFMGTWPFVESVSRFWTSHTSAIEWQGVRVETPVVAPGGVLSLVYRAKINKQCPSDLRGFLIEEDGSVPVRLPIIAGGYRPPNDDFVEIRVKIQVPTNSDPGLAPLTDGKYTYRATATRYCPDGVELDTAIPDAPFTISHSVVGEITSNETVSLLP